MASWIKNSLRQDEIEQEKLPEQKLWKAVLSQAIYEACTNFYQGSPLTAAERGRAKNWINIFNPDFKQVCEWAGYNPEYILFKAKQIEVKKDRINEEIALKRKHYREARNEVVILESIS